MPNNHKSYGSYEKYVKRLLDVFCALAVMLIFCWLFAILALLVLIKLGSPVLFTQERPGKDEKIFKLYKFRSMTDRKDENGKLLPDERRLTKFGRHLRASSLDELPEVFNILKGDMSLVGPRPLLVSYLPYYTDEERHRHDIRPGLTGWAQVNGRNTTSWDARFQYDLTYVRHCSFFFDCKILLLTVIQVLNHSDVVVSGTKMSLPNFDEERRQKNEESQNESIR